MRVLLFLQCLLLAGYEASGVAVPRGGKSVGQRDLSGQLPPPYGGLGPAGYGGIPAGYNGAPPGYRDLPPGYGGIPVGYGGPPEGYGAYPSGFGTVSPGHGTYPAGYRPGAPGAGYGCCSGQMPGGYYGGYRQRDLGGYRGGRAAGTPGGQADRGFRGRRPVNVQGKADNQYGTGQGGYANVPNGRAGRDVHHDDGSTSRDYDGADYSPDYRTSGDY